MTTRTPHTTVNPRLEASLGAWLDAGLLDPDQAEAIRSFESSAMEVTMPARPQPAPRRIPVVAEALGYLGGMLGTIGLVLLAAKYWSDMGTAGRLAATVITMVVLTLAGMMVPHRNEPALERLRSFVWLGATASGALAGGVFAKDVLDASWVPSMVLGAAVVVTLHSLLLWWHHDRPVQQATFLVGAFVLAGTAAAEVTSAASAAGLVVWAAAAVALAVGLLRRTTRGTMTVAIGAAGMVVGAAITSIDDRGSGLLFTVLTAAAMVLASGIDVVPAADDRTALGVVGLAGMLQAGPQTIMWFGEDAGVVTGLTVFAVGVTLLLGARLRAVVTPLLAQLAGGALLVLGAAVTGLESVALATTFGLVVAVGLLGLGTVPDHALLTIFGCVGLLVNVPWAISHFFPGEGRAPLLIAVSGVLIVLVAVWLARQGGELKHQLGRRGRRPSGARPLP